MTQPPAGACQIEPAVVPMAWLSTAPFCNRGATVGCALLDGDWDGGADAVMLGVTRAVTDAVAAADTPRVSDAVIAADGVTAAVTDAVAVGVALGEHIMYSVCVDACVSRIEATVVLLPSRARNVLLYARVSQVLAMPAAVQAAGGVQQVAVGGAFVGMDKAKRFRAFGLGNEQF